ncbi:MAG: bifunctional diguanylate cyclase/phosphodiesterase [Rhizobiaceae bacterium]|nr:bifunctional diguanylate cyclase/phosphodiesterase [Rhizobiaceae bacterium]
MITAIMAGILSAGAAALIRVPKAATAWLLLAGTIHAIVAYSAWLKSGLLTDKTIAIFAVLATFGLIASVRDRAKADLKSFLKSQNLKEKSEVIDLLLKDYEAQSSEWLWEVNAEGYTERLPEPIMDMLGFNHDEHKTQTMPSLVKDLVIEESTDARYRLMEQISERQEINNVTLGVKDVRENKTRWIMLRGKPLYEDGEYKGYRGICADATQAVEAERHIKYLARHDALTGLVNRTTQRELLNQWQKAERSYIFMLVDLDHFKMVNDTYGHAVGDEVLVGAAERMRKAVNEAGFKRENEFSIARIGGDEFSIACAYDRRRANYDLDLAAEAIAETLVRSIGSFFRINDHDIKIGASIGYVLSPADGQNVAELANKADIALYKAKSSGRSTYHKFEKSMDEAEQTARKLENELKSALTRGQFSIAYQPIVSYYEQLGNESPVHGMEALLRWDHPELGSIQPADFIPIAEKTGAIKEIGEWVLREACAEAASWDDDRTVAVNVSVRQFQSKGFIQTMLGALASSGLTPRRLEIEITESVLADDPELTVHLIRQLRNIGVSVALDDFGTGYSSLSYISDFDVDRIKIDRSFVEKLAFDDTNTDAIIKAVTSLASSLGLKTVGEGVETLEQAEKLAELGCDFQQGFFFGRPNKKENASTASNTATVSDHQTPDFEDRQVDNIKQAS